MSQTIKKYFSVFFLMLFLFPIVEKEIHALEHAGDPHCISENKHFHNLEHNCGICDFTLYSSDGSTNIGASYTLFCFSFSYTPSINSIYELNRIDNSGSRAPPVI